MNKKINLLTKAIKTIFHYIFLITKKIISIIRGVFKIIKLIVGGIVQRFKRLLRFSITFKITFVYTVILSLLLFLVSMAILFGFKFFLIEQMRQDIQNNSEIYFFILLGILVVINIIIIFITMIIGSSVSKKIISPIDDMTETVRAINIQKLDTRLNVKGSHDELKELAQTFNDMFDRVQESYERQNQFVSDASHELRTPIAVIQGYVNLLDRWGKNDKEVLEESIEAIKSESENMKELVEKLLFLARADKKTQKVEKTQFYLDELIDEVVKETKLIDTKHEIVNKTYEKILIFADRKLLKQTLRIFIDNSMKFTPENGSIAIEGAYSSKDKAVLIIEDTGIGIPKEDISYIFNRFYRSDKSRSKDKGGTGLGLSIAKWIISQHKGIVEVKSAVDVGTKISIFLALKGS
ncbi:sensor histidine kinase [Clostridium sp. ZS2-4]|uniref:sensor histidine kinase n=1 Tax=Clostridium sp. ZS2-4 TaxID=2987703 RepID=UPI00227D0ABC|nr:HAMP domain-containing sensor histidine kinase [Clostridium sp. ZS2-4]MCY6354286.1 ATP-binding protein [Clostridium sp. ZS2-4]